MIDHPYLYPLLSKVGYSKILNTHNVEFHLWRETWLSKVFLAPLVKKIEERAISLSDEVWCCSQEEKRVLSEMGNHKVPVVVIPNTVAPIEKRPEWRSLLRTQLFLEEDAKVILFTASRYAPNVDAFRFLEDFCRNHFELLEALNVYFLVVGSVTSLKREGRLIATGPVEEVAPYFSVADWAINPVLTGSGTSVKMVEYREANIPILSTPFGARGLGLSEGIDFIPFQREELGRVLIDRVGKAV